MEAINERWRQLVCLASPQFRIRIASEIARIELTQHFAAPEEARALVEPFVRAWELDAELKHGLDALRFAYQGAEVIALVGIALDLAHVYFFDATTSARIRRPGMATAAA